MSGHYLDVQVGGLRARMASARVGAAAGELWEHALDRGRTVKDPQALVPTLSGLRAIPARARTSRRGRCAARRDERAVRVLRGLDRPRLGVARARASRSDAVRGSRRRLGGRRGVDRPRRARSRRRPARREGPAHRGGIRSPARRRDPHRRGARRAARACAGVLPLGRRELVRAARRGAAPASA